MKPTLLVNPPQQESVASTCSKHLKSKFPIYGHTHMRDFGHTSVN